eukprot:6813037-Lingulodinium_polyedra.AAC.1
MDSFVLSMLNRDAEGRSLLDMVMPNTSPLRVLQRDLLTTLADVSARLVLRQFDFHGQERRAMLQSMRGVTLEMAGSVYYRLQIYFEQYPYKMLRLIRPGATEQQKRRWCQEAYDAPQCCLDPFFAQRL